LQHGVELGEHSRWVLDRQLDRLAWMTGELRRVEKRLHQAMQDNRLVRYLLTIKGVGYVTAWTLRTEIGRFDRFRGGRQLARFCGLSPCNRSSGAKVADAGLIHAANPELRRVLIEAAWSLIRHQPRWRQLASSLRQRGKSGSVTCAAVANWFVRWLWHQVMKNIENVPCADRPPVATTPVG
jgi:transposase